jgi:hypothetical protein
VIQELPTWQNPEFPNPTHLLAWSLHWSTCIVIQSGKFIHSLDDGLLQLPLNESLHWFDEHVCNTLGFKLM